MESSNNLKLINSKEIQSSNERAITNNLCCEGHKHKHSNVNKHKENNHSNKNKSHKQMHSHNRHNHEEGINKFYY